MNKLVVFILTLTLLSSCCKIKKDITFSNPSDKVRKDVPVVITKEQLINLFGKEITTKIPIVQTSDGKIIPSQTDDMNIDGLWDELAFVLSFEPSQEIKIIFKLTDPSKINASNNRTNIRFAIRDTINNSYTEIKSATRLPGTQAHMLAEKILQYEGPCLENDKVGFRNYFDERNGFDIFGKTTSSMVMDSASIKGSYHKLQDWGMDILKVGNSLGAGSLALAIGDSIYRIGDGCYNDKATLDIISEGPVRSIIKFNFINCPIGGRNYNLSQQVSIWAGSYAYESRVLFDSIYGDEKLVIGIVNLQSKKLNVDTTNSSFIILSTHDKQSFENEYLGLGLIVSKKDFSKADSTVKEGKKITQTYYASLNIEAKTPIFYSFYAGWEKSDENFKDANFFQHFLQQEAVVKEKPYTCICKFKCKEDKSCKEDNDSCCIRMK